VSVAALAAVGVMAPATFLSSAAAQPVPKDQLIGGLLVADLSLDGVWITRDLDGDGNARDAGESSIWFDASNESGLPEPTGSPFSLFVSIDRSVFVGDGGTDSVYRLVDLNNDRDANDAGEATVWFSAAASGADLATPNGLWQDDAGALYILTAGTSSTQDAIYRTIDLNDDGDALDPGEASLWFDLQSLVPDSSAFELVFIGEAAFFVDLLGSGTDAIIRAVDADGDGMIEAGEFDVFLDDANPFGVAIGLALATDGQGLYVMENLGSQEQILYRLEDLNGDGFIDAFDEVTELWNESLVPDGVELGSSNALAVGPDGQVMVASSGGTAADNLFRLVDVDGDGRFLGAGETLLYLDGGDGSGDLLDNPRSLAHALPRVGDVNADDRIDFNDVLELLALFGPCSACPADQDFDGDVDFDDLLLVLANFDPRG